MSHDIARRSFFVRVNRLLIWSKDGLGYNLGDFFTSSSGHPAHGTSIALNIINWLLVPGRPRTPQSRKSIFSAKKLFFE
jgi:hypothetical protein